MRRKFRRWRGGVQFFRSAGASGHTRRLSVVGPTTEIQRRTLSEFIVVQTFILHINSDRKCIRENYFLINFPISAFIRLQAIFMLLK